MRKCSVIFAGGKTGGHLFPGVALAEYLEARLKGRVKIIFVGLKGGIEERVIPKKGWNLEFVPMSTPRVGGLMGIFRFFFYSFPVSLLKSFYLIARERPALIVALGGYSGFPVAFAGWLMMVPVVILEQNVHMGLTNRILSFMSRKVFLPFEDPRHGGRKYVVSGNPVRELKVTADKGDGRFVIGILGGSQGAKGLNDLIKGVLPEIEDLKDRIKFIHQVGRQSVEEMKGLYDRYGFEADVRSFIDDMGWFYGNCDLIISRAGATTIAELISVGKGAILVPFPHAADDHQRKNAIFLADRGAAILFDEKGSPSELADIIRRLMTDRSKLDGMSEAMKGLRSDDPREIIWKEIKVYLEKPCLEK